ERPVARRSLAHRVLGEECDDLGRDSLLVGYEAEGGERCVVTAIAPALATPGDAAAPARGERGVDVTEPAVQQRETPHPRPRARRVRERDAAAHRVTDQRYRSRRERGTNRDEIVSEGLEAVL